MNQYNNSNNFSQNNFIKNQNGYNTPPLEGDFVGLYNLLSTHPILPKRIKALVIRNKSGDLF